MHISGSCPIKVVLLNFKNFQLKWKYCVFFFCYYVLSAKTDLPAMMLKADENRNGADIVLKMGWQCLAVRERLDG